jgi:DNA polymerase III delta prime subunit
MHAFIIVCRQSEEVEKEISKLLDRLTAERIDFSLEKIADVRDLFSFTKLKTDKKTAIVAKNLENSTLEALNAFLKILEEPQENLFFILTTDNEASLPATIVSRCSVIHTKLKGKSIGFDISSEFLKKTIGEKFQTIEKIKKKDEAVVFIQQLILGFHNMLIKGKTPSDYANLIKEGNITLLNLRANGNVGLQLSRFVVASN